MRKNSLIILTLIGSLSLAKPSDPVVKTSPPVPSKSVSKEDSKKILDGGLSQKQESVQVLMGKITAFSTVEKIEKNPTKILSIKKNKAGLWLSVARAIRANQKDTKITADESKALDWVIVESNYIIKSGPVKDQAYAYYTKGMAEVDLNQNEKSIVSFQKSIELDPTSAWTPTLALFIGENYFEKENYDKAIEYYTKYLPRMSSLQKSLALYKTAWCHIGRKNWVPAAQMLATVISEGRSNEFKKDSLRDLAFVMVQGGDEKQIIAKAQILMSKQFDPEVIFLTSAYNFLQRESKKKGIEVYQVLLGMQKDPIKRVELRLSFMRTIKSDELTQNYLLAFQELQKELVTKWKSWPLIQEKLGKEIETEFESMLAHVVKIQSGKTKTDSSLKQTDIAILYKSLIKTHLEFFPKTAMRLQLVEALLDFCQIKNDQECVTKSSDEILKDPSLSKLHERAFLIQLDRVQSAYAKEPKFKVEYKEKLDLFLKKFSQSSQVLEVKKRLLNFYIKEKSWTEVQNLSTQIFQIEKSADIYYQIQWARYNLGHYQEIIDQPEQGFEKNDKKFISLRRESTLKLASEAKLDTDADFSKYESNILNFIKMSDDLSKKKQAVLHYMESATKKKKYAELIKFYMSQKSEYQMDPDIVTWVKTVLVENYLNYNLDIWTSLFKNTPAYPEQKYRSLYQDEIALYTLITSSSDIKKIWFNLPPQKRKSLLDQILLCEPKLWFQLGGVPKNPNKNEKALIYLALQLDQKTTDPQMNNQDKKLLHEVLPENKKIYDEVVIETNLKKLITKQAKKSKKLKTIKSLMDSVQKTRSQVQKSMKSEPAVVKVRILSNAIIAEQNMVQLILDSEVPKELEASQVDEYKTGLVSLSDEFKNQVLEYDKIKSKILETEKASLEKSTMKAPAPNLEKWKLPADVKSEAFQKAFTQYGLFFTLTYLDMRKNRKELSESEFSWARSWILLKQNNPALTQYLYDELTAQKQEEISKEWERKE